MQQIQKATAVAVVALAAGVPAAAQPSATSEVASDQGKRILEEVIVTARRRDETLLDVPVTVTSIKGDQLAAYQLDQVEEIAERVPNFRVQSGGSGSGGTLSLRGVGSSSISAAFDSAVALDIDGVQIGRMRMVQSALVDLQQVDVLKGPQSLYFGKSASAGVVSFRSADPTATLEANLRSGYEFELDGRFIEGFVSGPLSETLGGRLAFRYAETDEVWTNTAPNAQDPEAGEEDLVVRGTLNWAPREDFNANIKVTRTSHEADHSIGPTDVWCPDGLPSTTTFGGLAGLPSGHDCEIEDERVVVGAAGPLHATNFGGIEDITPFSELDTLLARMQLDWTVADWMTVTSVTGYFDLDQFGADNFGRDINGFGTAWSLNKTESFSQELRFVGDLGKRVSYQAGILYQDRELVRETAQHAVGAAQLNVNVFGLPAADPVTGFTSDWQKRHVTDSETLSGFFSLTVRPVDRLTLTAGVRLSDDERTQNITLPAIHSTLTNILGFLSPGFESGDIDFEDKNTNPEVTALYELTRNINLFAAYKTGYKSGGVDNSALPSQSLRVAAQNNDFGALIFDTEEAEGFEVGMKGRFRDDSLRMDATGFRYVYEDLQVQNFDQETTQFNTTNAGELTTQGLELDVSWLPPVDGLSLTGAFSYLDAEYTESFLPQPPAGVTDPAILAQFDLEDRAPSGAADFAFNLGADYERSIPGTRLMWTAGVNTSWTDEYEASTSPAGFVQDAYWLVNARASIGAEDGRWKASVMGRNLTDEIYTIGSGGRPFATSDTNSLLPNGAALAEQLMFVSRGRQLFLQFELNL